MVAVPADSPETRPVVELAVAMEDALLIHVPPVLASNKVTDDPIQIESEPLIAAGSGKIVPPAVT